MIRKAFFFLFAALLMSCQSNEIHSDFVTLPNHWSLEQNLEFIIPEIDSLTNYNIFFTVRNTNEFKFSNLFLIAAIHFPNGKVVQDTLEYQMANPDGTWLGTGNRVKENKLWYKENIRFFEEGNYRIKLRHAMRNNASIMGVNKLEGITDVGIIIEKSQADR
ncbi:MAG: gliding motility lipoprotein GldH [Flavobacteriaceae bacterium]|nr:gliding motility lipoprotein GldH [Flavobacteriaceae bacterium]